MKKLLMQAEVGSLKFKMLFSNFLPKRDSILNQVTTLFPPK